jgi:hypothetical protein
MNVGVMKDYKLIEIRASHTLGWLHESKRPQKAKRMFFISDLGLESEISEI